MMVRLLSVGKVEASDKTGNVFFKMVFKSGPFGKGVLRTLWGEPQEDGSVQWERISPEEAADLEGRDLSEHVSIHPVEIEPQEFLIVSTGEVKMITSRAVVRFSDETLEQAVRRSGSELRKEEPVQAALQQAAAMQAAGTPAQLAVQQAQALNGVGAR